MNKRTLQDYQALADKRDFKYQSATIPPNTRTKQGTVWLCGKGHEWEARYKKINEGQGCPTCSDNKKRAQPNPRRKKPADYHALAHKRGFKWLGPEASNVKTKTGWECKQGHQWQARYKKIADGDSCPSCSLVSRRKTPQDYHALAETCGFAWRGKTVPKTTTKTRWQCGEGHKFSTTFKLLNRSRRCPVCSLRIKFARDYHALAQKRGFRWVGAKPKNTRLKTTWECSKGHRWESPYNSIHTGRGCMRCHRERKSKIRT